MANALHHNEPGGWIRLSAEKTVNRVKIAVENTGAGIAPAHLPHVFERYYRADETRSIAPQSRGLGLAIVHAIMRLHDGEVYGQSVPGKTTLFVLLFDSACAPEITTGLAPDQTSSPVRYQPAPRKVDRGCIAADFARNAQQRASDHENSRNRMATVTYRSRCNRFFTEARRSTTCAKRRWTVFGNLRGMPPRPR